MSCALPVVCPRPLRNNEPAVGGVRLLRAFRPSSGAVADNQPYASCQQGRVENVLPSARRADGNDVLGPLLADRRSGAMLRCQCDRPVLLPLALFVSADRRHAFHGGLRAAAVEAVGKRVVVGSDDFPIPDPFVFQRPFRFLERPVDRGAVRADGCLALCFPRASASGRERQPEYGPDEDLALRREWNGIPAVMRPSRSVSNAGFCRAIRSADSFRVCST